MSFVSWLFGKAHPANDLPGDLPGDGPLGAHSAPDIAPSPVSEKTERSRRREAVYSTVRESMVSAGVLSATYKFKVLSTDPAGHRYVIMVDLTQPLVGGVDQMSWIEGLMERMAQARHDIHVAAVYWRVGGPVQHVPKRRRAATRIAPQAVEPKTPLPTAPRVHSSSGYEDTQQVVPSQPVPELSATQYGDLD